MPVKYRLFGGMDPYRRTMITVLVYGTAETPVERRRVYEEVYDAARRVAEVARRMGLRVRGPMSMRTLARKEGKPVETYRFRIEVYATGPEIQEVIRRVFGVFRPEPPPSYFEKMGYTEWRRAARQWRAIKRSLERLFEEWEELLEREEEEAEEFRRARRRRWSEVEEDLGL